MTTLLPAGPERLGLELSADATVSDDGWLERALYAAPGLDGPPGILQGGLAAGVCIAIARQADRFDAPLTGFDARLHAPTPLGRELRARVRGTDVPARYEVETRHGDTLLVTAEVELAGHDPAPRAFDLLDLAMAPLPVAVPQYAFPTCVICGPHPTHPLGQRLHPRPATDRSVIMPWVADEELGVDGGVDDLLISALLDCPTVWASMDHVRSLGHTGALLSGYHLRVFRAAPVMEALRIVGLMDEADGRKIQARAAVVDEQGVTYAVSSALQISVAEVPVLDPS
jgi:hypothetical protein